MSKSHLFALSAYPRTPLTNGVGRYICQLQRVTLKFCKNQGPSKGIRDFIEFGLMDFAKKNPGVAIYLKPRRHRTPCIVAEYLNGGIHHLNCRDLDGTEVGQWLQVYLTSSGYPEQRLIKLWHTKHPSIQGPWTPFTNRDTATIKADLFQPEHSKRLHLPPSATEQLIEIFQKQQLGEQGREEVIEEAQ